MPKIAARHLQPARRAGRPGRHQRPAPDRRHRQLRARPQGRRRGDHATETQNTQSPYNTYLHPGLPPGPINSPGDEAIKAAVHPADGPWYYYVTVNLRTGLTQVRHDVPAVPAVPAGARRSTARPRRLLRPGRCAAPSSVTRSSTRCRPPLHRAAYAALGLDWTYDAVRVPAGGWRTSWPGSDAAWRGLSLTMPLKREAMPLLDVAGRLGQAVRRRQHAAARRGRRARPQHRRARRRGRAAARRPPASLERAVVLGGGATATSVLLALAELGCARRRAARCATPARAAETVEAVRRHPRAPSIEVGRSIERRPAVGRRRRGRPTIPAAAQTRAAARGRAPTCRSSSTWSTTRGRHRWRPRRAERPRARRRARPAAVAGGRPGARDDRTRSTYRSRRCAPRARRDSPNAVADRLRPLAARPWTRPCGRRRARPRWRRRRALRPDADRADPRASSPTRTSRSAHRSRPGRTRSEADGDRRRGAAEGPPGAVRRHRGDCPAWRWRSAVASAVAGAVVGAGAGLDLGAGLWVPLVPVCVALAVVDWRTRLLPTAVIRPAYVGCWSCWCSSAGLVDRRPDALCAPRSGWLVAGVVLRGPVVHLPARARLRRRPSGRACSASRWAGSAGGRCSSGCTPASCSAASSAACCRC